MFVEFQSATINTSQINYVTEIRQSRNGGYFFEIEFTNKTASYANQSREELEKLHNKLIESLPK